MSLVGGFLNLYKRNSVFLATVFFGAYGFSVLYTEATEKWWEYHNRGKLWKDIRDKYVQES